jgi:16S rRNA (cytidine1402-2'-O)-methyltransferase
MIYLIPSFLSENAVQTIPPYVMDAVRDCAIIFAENERTARRFLKSMDKAIDINSFEWHTIEKDESKTLEIFRMKLRENKNIAIISEAGCPGVADPGQAMIAEAQQAGVSVKPLVGPNSILLALMASGMNGQQFSFLGYLPIENVEKIKAIKKIEEDSIKNKSTQIFIETPYRNNQILESILQSAKPSTRLCIAVNLTAAEESIRTMTISEWTKEKVDLHKKPVIFLLQA